ncbi:peptide-methionine (S)-S-oxide reductase MsrA [Arenibacter lacus]|uniref:peptide-methionine (S)-S-oxide reductase MsrA n=1 Tax=Arenibacter lacus TaxID=2608629 RepID=UPI00123CBF38|nr:peptide-methionine (S)-S-oxide reductase MsrA [Arenibacter lacus]
MRKNRIYRKKVQLTLLFLLGLISLNCLSVEKSETKTKKIAVTTPQNLQELDTAYFASGCFWCVEAIFEELSGVKEAVSGYAGGKEVDPSYKAVANGLTSHAETVAVYYDPKRISFQTLVTVFFGSHDPTTLNRQGPDHGPQYRSIAFYKTEKEKKIITDHIATLTEQKVYRSPIVTEVSPFTIFYQAEEYHQDYKKKHPNNPYIQNVSIPRLRKFQKKFPHLLKTRDH